MESMGKINLSEIAKKLARHRSTIKRELKRNETLKAVKVSCPKDIYKVKKNICMYMITVKLIKKLMLDKEIKAIETKNF